MKKIILLLAFTYNVSCIAQQATDTIPHMVPFFKQKYDGKNGAIAWIGVGTIAMSLGGTCQFISVNPKMPFPKLFGNQNFFNNVTIQNETTQKSLNTAFGVGVGIASISVLLATYDFGYYLVNKKRNSTVKIKANPTSIGICLNF